MGGEARTSSFPEVTCSCAVCCCGQAVATAPRIDACLVPGQCCWRSVGGSVLKLLPWSGGLQSKQRGGKGQRSCACPSRGQEPLVQRAASGAAAALCNAYSIMTARSSGSNRSEERRHV